MVGSSDMVVAVMISPLNTPLKRESRLSAFGPTVVCPLPRPSLLAAPQHDMDYQSGEALMTFFLHLSVPRAFTVTLFSKRSNCASRSDWSRAFSLAFKTATQAG